VLFVRFVVSYSGFPGFEAAAGFSADGFSVDGFEAALEVSFALSLEVLSEVEASFDLDEEVVSDLSADSPLRA
jgi:hypothetical protein